MRVRFLEVVAKVTAKMATLNKTIRHQSKGFCRYCHCYVCIGEVCEKCKSVIAIYKQENAKENRKDRQSNVVVFDEVKPLPAKPMSTGDTFICMCCLGEIEADDYPAECCHCHVGSCVTCGTRARHDQKMCFGCGNIKPVIQANVSRSDNTSAVYGSVAWMKDSVLMNPKRKFMNRPIEYFTVTHVVSGEHKGQVIIARQSIDMTGQEIGQREDFHVCTDEEVAILGVDR